MNSRTSLILLCQKYPFESGEEFLLSELKELEKEFDKIILIPTGARDLSFQREVGVKTTVITVNNPKTLKEIGFNLISNLFSVIPKLYFEMKVSGWNLKLLKYYLYHIPFALKIKSEISKVIEMSTSSVLYSYWMDTNAYACSLVKKKYPELKLVVKSHRGDLYNEVQPFGSVAFRETVYQAAESLVFISEHGYDYASTHYPKYALKMNVFRLGVEDHGSAPTYNFPKIFHIVSCSSLVSVKRVSLIAEVLNTCTIPIFWTHFGGENSEIGELQNSLNNKRENLKVNWKGKVDNSDIHSYYASNHIDLLINLSSSEGIPVSMMEAISFGIPLFANAVGGIPEIAGAETGRLLPEGLSVKMLAFHLEEFLLSGKTRDLQFREGVKKFYLENYNAKSNYERLIMHLKKHSFKAHKSL